MKFWKSRRRYIIESLILTSKFCWISDGQQEIATHMKDILKGLREFKKSSRVASEMLKVFSEGSESSAVSFCFRVKSKSKLIYVLDVD